MLTYLGFIDAAAHCVRFSMVSYCGNTRRIGVGAKNGSLAVYDLKQSKCQVHELYAAGASLLGLLVESLQPFRELM